MRHLLVASSLLALASPTFADTTPQSLPFSQDWSNTNLITAADDWSGVPGIVGFLGQNTATSTGGIDPRTVLTESTAMNDVSVLANQTAATSTAGDVGEFQLADPVVALQASGTADTPYLLITIATSGVTGVRVRYNVRDIDGTNDDAIQPVVLQYRVGTSGPFTNVPDAYIADATTGPGLASLVTPVNVVLPAAVDDQPIVQLRIMTGNAVGSDEWIGIDDIQILQATTKPSAVGMASPASALRGATVTVTANVTPGEVPTSTGLAVACDLSSIGGSATQALFDDGTNGDATAGDNVWTFVATVDNATAAGMKTFACTVSDAENRSSNFTISFAVAAQCGDGIVEGSETCDDGGMMAGDGCSAACAIEPGYQCNGSPSVCTDIDECTNDTDDCDALATCTNTPPGSFTCTCPSGYEGDGHTGGTGCTDIDECTANTDNCDANATCTNSPGSFSCACNDGYSGDGTACTDIDECTAGTDNCDANATCANTAGSFTCTCAAGFSGNGVQCMPNCGDGALKGPEACDDGNMIAGDGCSANCAVETGFTCTGTPSSCAATCGDGARLGAEQCDDGNTAGADGCSATCTIEEGWTCAGDPSTCEPPDDGGCCSSSTRPGGVALLVLFVIAGLRRRQRG